jgi:hypothetical protein
LTVPILAEEFREIHFRAGLHHRMNEELNAVIDPHSPNFLGMGNQNRLEVDPVRIDAIMDTLVGLNPVASMSPGSGFSVQKLPSMYIS